MKTVIIGGGRGCRAILETLAAGHLPELGLEVVCVADIRPDSPGIEFANQHGLQTVGDYREALALPEIELVLEMTGNRGLMADIYQQLPRGVRIIDHLSARIFWDLISLEQSLRNELEKRTLLKEKIAADRQRYQDILDTLPDIVVVLDPDKKIRVINDRFNKEGRTSTGEAIGRHCGEVFCQADWDPKNQGRGCPFDQAVALGVPVSSIIERSMPIHGFYEVTASPVYDDDGKLVEVVETHHPVTERILLQRGIETSEHRLRQFIETATDIISIKDRSGRYLVVNPATAQIFGKNPKEFIGKTASELYDRKIAKMINMHDREVIEKKKLSRFSEVVDIDDHEYFLETTRFPLFTYGGHVEGVCTIARDVTEQRQMQQQLLQAAKLAAVGKLAAGVAHEINNPLTGVLAYAEELLDDAAPDDERSQDYKVIIRETLRCREIVRNLLDYARQDAPNLQTADLNKVVDRALTLIRKQARFYNIDLELDLSKQPLIVDAEGHQIQQIILNLLINAADAMQRCGTIRIASGWDDRECWVAVGDSGPGVPEADRARIFEPFYSTKSTTGLGLAVSWGIIDRHGGNIEVGDSPLGGAKFTIILPQGAEPEGDE